MRTIKIPVGVGNAGDINIGRRGENGVTAVVFDVSQMVKTYGAGTAVLMARRPGDTSAYPVPAVQSGDTVTWTVSDTDTSNDGRGTAELFWYIGSNLAKSVVFSTSVYKDIGVPVGEAPDPYETWLDTLTELAAETQGAAASITGMTAEAETLEPGSAATASYADGVLTLGIPAGPAGTSDYADLTNKPQIEGVTLIGNKTAADLGLAKSSDIPTSGVIPAASSATPEALGTASTGSSDSYARGDHVHPMPSAADVGALPDDTNIPAVAQPFSTSASYTEGEYCEYGGATCRFIADKAAGAFDPTKVVVVYIANDVWALSQRPSGSGLSAEVKAALLACFRHVAWADDDGQDYYDALETALYPPADVASISAVYIQIGTVYDTDTLDSLRSDLVVTATYTDSSTATVTTYTLSGTLAAPTSTITVSYGGKTTTFSVSVTSQYGGYVEHGLLMLLDGIANGANGTHASTISTLVDQSGNGHNWETNTGTVTATAKALVFDGAADLKGTGWSEGMTEPKTVEVVVNVTNPATTQCIIAGVAQADGVRGTSVGSLCVKANSILHETGGAKGCLAVASGTHTYSFVNNNGTWEGYIDGVLTSFGATTSSWDSGAKRLGGFSNNSGTSSEYRFTGSIYSLRMYSDALTASEIAANRSNDAARFS